MFLTDVFFLVQQTTNELKGEEILTAQDNKQIRKVCQCYLLSYRSDQKYVFLEYQIYNSFVAQTIASIRAKLGKKKSENVLLKKLKVNFIPTLLLFRSMSYFSMARHNLN